jgi:Na+/H+-dicarboxylate symporter
VTVRPELPPGAAEAASSLSAGAPVVGFSNWLLSLIPTNPIAAAANGAMLPLILFTLLLALAIAHAPADGATRCCGSLARWATRCWCWSAG